MKIFKNCAEYDIAGKKLAPFPPIGRSALSVAGQNVRRLLFRFERAAPGAM